VANQATSFHFVRHFLESIATCRKFGIKQVKWNERRRSARRKKCASHGEKGKREGRGKPQHTAKSERCGSVRANGFRRRLFPTSDAVSSCLDYFVLQILQISSSVIALRSAKLPLASSLAKKAKEGRI
jgi:hypothetical protein